MIRAVFLDFKKSFWAKGYGLVFVAITLFYLYLSSFFVKTTMVTWAGGSTYHNIFLGIFVMLISIVYFSESNDFLCSIYRKEKILFNTFVALFVFFSIFTLVVNLLVLILNMIQGVEIKILLSNFVKFTLQDTLTNFLRISLALLLSQLFSRNVAFAFVLPLVLIFSPMLQIFLSMPVLTIFQPMIEDPTQPTAPQFVNLITEKFMFQTLACLMISMACFFISFLLNVRKRQTFVAYLLASLIFILALFPIFKLSEKNAPSQRYTYLRSEVLEEEHIISTNYKVHTMNLELDTGRRLRGNVVMEIEKVEDNKEFVFLLERELTDDLKEIFVNDVPVKFTVEEDFVHVNIGSLIERGDKGHISFQYGGKLNLPINPRFEVYFSNGQNCNLIGGLPWYPIVNESEEKEIILHVDGKYPILTNLNGYKLLPKGEHVIEGRAKYLMLSIGDYGEFHVDDMTYIASKELFKKREEDIEELISVYINSLNDDMNKIVLYPTIFGYEKLDKNALILKQ